MLPVSWLGAEVLDHLVGVQDVAPDLVAPAGLDVLAAELADLRLLLLERPLEQPRLEDLDRRLLVLGLDRSFWLWATIPVGRWVRRTAESVLLTCWPPAPWERNVSTRISSQSSSISTSLLGLGQDLDEGERRLAPVLRVERADPDEPVDAALGPQPAVGAPAVDRDGHALEARPARPPAGRGSRSGSGAARPSAGTSAGASRPSRSPRCRRRRR